VRRFIRTIELCRACRWRKARAWAHSVVTRQLMVYFLSVTKNPARFPKTRCLHEGDYHHGPDDVRRLKARRMNVIGTLARSSVAQALAIMTGYCLANDDVSATRQIK
jgi:hypothetical protein